MKKSTKISIIVTAVVVAAIIGLGVIFAFVPLGGLGAYEEFHTATIIREGGRVGGQNDIRLFNEEGLGDSSPDQYEAYNQLRRVLGRSYFTLLHGIFEWGLGPRVSVPDDERRLGVHDINNLTPEEGEFLLKIEFSQPRTKPRALWLPEDELFACGDDPIRDNANVCAFEDSHTLYDTIVLRVVDSANEIILIDAYAFLRNRLHVVNEICGCSPQHYFIIPMQIRAVTTRLYNALTDISDNWQS